MVSKSIKNKWMREVKPGVYRFLNIHTHRDLDDNITSFKTIYTSGHYLVGVTTDKSFWN
jgi:hypothetical protein